MDVLLFQGNDGGDVNVENGNLETTGGLPTAAYLSLFGGNEQDDGRPDNAAQWWGNSIESQSDRQQRSETQFLLRAIPAVSSNLKRLQDAAERDLAWLVSIGAATSVEVSVTLEALNRVKFEINVEADSESSVIAFVENWGAQ